jgi:hypothetical protein
MSDPESTFRRNDAYLHVRRPGTKTVRPGLPVHPADGMGMTSRANRSAGARSTVATTGAESFRHDGPSPVSNTARHHS